METIRKNRVLLIILAVLVLLFLFAVQGMSTSDWVITVFRGISTGAVTPVRACARTSFSQRRMRTSHAGSSPGA